MKQRLNIRTAIYVTLGMCIFTVAGCSVIGRNPSPPTALEAKFFDFETNSVPRMVTVTNTVLQTNMVTVTTTNELNQIIPRFVEQVVPVPQIVNLTNWHDDITYTPKASTTAAIQTAGTIGNAVYPGVGGIIVGVLGGIAAAWGKLRGAKKTNGVLVQNVQAAREVLKTVPGGDKLDLAFTSFIQKHQNEVGVAGNVADLIKEFVNSAESREAAGEIKEMIAAFQKPS